MYNLTVYSGDDIVTESDIEKAELLIGKGTDVDVNLKGWNIGKIHARLVMSVDDVFIEDNGSLFGTYVNDERVIRHGPLSNEDVIRIGQYTLSIISSHMRDRINATGMVSVSAQDGGQQLVKRSSLSLLKTTPVMATDETPALPKQQHMFQQVAVVDDPGRPDMQARVRSENELLFDYWRHFVHEAVLSEMDVRRVNVNRLKDEDLRSNVRLIIRDVISACRDLPKDIDVTELSRQVLDEAVGLGPLEPLLADEAVSEIMVNKFDEIWIERRGQLTLSTATFSSDAAVLGAIERIVTPLGRRIDESSPMVDARLKDGSRVNAIIPPLAIRGPSLTIRKFSKHQISGSDFVEIGSMTDDMLMLIKTIVGLRLNVIISGGTGTGKTTFLNMLGNFIATNERIVTIEDAAELKLTQPNRVSLESRPPNLEGKGAIAIRDLLRNSLRMRPDRIIVGECRGGEALDMLQAMNTGHDGSMTTLHANSPRDAMARLEVLVLMAGMALPVRAIREQIASAVQVVVQLTRFSCGARKVTNISEIVGMEGDIIQMQDVYQFRRTGRDAEDRTVGTFDYSGLKPDFLKRLEQ